MNFTELWIKVFKNLINVIWFIKIMDFSLIKSKILLFIDRLVENDEQLSKYIYLAI